MVLYGDEAQARWRSCSGLLAKFFESLRYRHLRNGSEDHVHMSGMALAALPAFSCDYIFFSFPFSHFFLVGIMTMESAVEICSTI